MYNPTVPRTSPIAKLCQFDVLSAQEERQLLRRLRAVRARSADRKERASASRAGPREAMAIRNRIVESNLRLVVSLAKRFASAPGSLEDLIADAMVPLIRCVESFDPARGTRFSTYATRALTNFFVKRRRQGRRRQFGLSHDRYLTPIAEQGHRFESLESLIHAEDLSSLQRRLARLPIRERNLVVARFGLTGDQEPRTFRELGIKYGLSKERVRIITSQAICRLRLAYTDGQAP